MDEHERHEAGSRPGPIGYTPCRYNNRNRATGFFFPTPFRLFFFFRTKAEEKEEEEERG